MSIYIGNIDYNATEDELRDTFIDCGDIVRVTIIKNMKTGHPKGAAFIEFTDKHGVEAAMNLDGKHVRGKIENLSFFLYFNKFKFYFYSHNNSAELYVN